MTSDEAAAKERRRLLVQLIDLCDKAGIKRPSSVYERELGLLALQAAPKGKAGGRPKAVHAMSQRSLKYYGLANWFRVKTGYKSWEEAYKRSALHLGVSPAAVKKAHNDIRKRFPEFEPTETLSQLRAKNRDLEADLKFWSEFLTDIADSSAPDLDR